MATEREREKLRAEMKRMLPLIRDWQSPAGARSRLLFHRLAVKAGLQAVVPPWIIENAREKGVQVK